MVFNKGKNLLKIKYLTIKKTAYVFALNSTIFSINYDDDISYSLRGTSKIHLLLYRTKNLKQASDFGIWIFVINVQVSNNKRKKWYK